MKAFQRKALDLLLSFKPSKNQHPRDFQLRQQGMFQSLRYSIDGCRWQPHGRSCDVAAALSDACRRSHFPRRRPAFETSENLSAERNLQHFSLATSQTIKYGKIYGVI